MAVWMDMTNSLYTWKGGVVGIIRAELEIAKNLAQITPDIKFCVSKEYGIEEVPRSSLIWLWETKSVSDAYIKNMRKNNDNDIETNNTLPLGLVMARSYSTGRLERIKRAGELWVNTLPVGRQWAGKVLFGIPFTALHLCSNARKTVLSVKQKSQNTETQMCPEFYHPFEDGDILFSCGWNNSNKELHYSKVKSLLRNFSLVYLIYDLVIVKEEFKPLFQGTAEFEWYLTWIAYNCDYLLYGGRTAQEDAEQFFWEHKLPKHPGYPIKFGSEIVEVVKELSKKTICKKYGIDDIYILAVGSFAPKKNYSTVYKAYTIMAKKYGLKNLPQLVIVGGRLGGDNLAKYIELDPHIAQKIVLVNPSDEELDVLYKNCRFTILPTLYEGWSLTLPESLGYGKFCLASDVAPLREIAGDMVDYVEPMDVCGWAENIMRLVCNKEYLSKRETRIANEWTSVTWQDCGLQVSTCLNSIYEKKTKKCKSVLYYDMTLAWQFALMGGGVGGILKTHLLLAKLLCCKVTDMKLCAFTEFGYIDLDRYIVLPLLMEDDIELGFQSMSLQIRQLYQKIASEQAVATEPTNSSDVKAKVNQEIFWLLCSDLPLKKQEKVAWWYENRCKQQNACSDIKKERRIIYDFPFKKGDVIFSSGLGIGEQAYIALLEQKKNTSFKFIQVLYDFIAVSFPHLYEKETRESYYAFLDYTYTISDVIYYGGKTALNDGEKYQKSRNMKPTPGIVIEFGSDIEKSLLQDDIKKHKDILEKYNIKSRYIIAVGNIDLLNNHETLYNAYIEMLKSSEELPQMLFCGYPGRGTEEFLNMLNRDERVRGRICVITPDKKELDILYKHCDFTVLAGLYEGWSFALLDSLNYGKMSLVSDVEPFRELGGNLVEYVEPYDIKSWAEKILYYFNNPKNIQKREECIKKEWNARSWDNCADQLGIRLIEELQSKEVDHK